ncbi:hypothetical protein FQZ97_886850 [compost metagenome]
MLHQPSAIGRGETLRLQAREFHLGQARLHAGDGRFAGRRLALPFQRRGLGHDQVVLALGHLVLADEIEHRLEQVIGLGLRQVRLDARAPIRRQVVQHELAVDVVPPVTGNEGLLVARVALTEGIAQVHLAVIQCAPRQDVDVTEDHFALAGQRQADIVRHGPGVVRRRGFLRQRGAGQQGERKQAGNGGARHRAILPRLRSAPPASRLRPRPARNRARWPATPSGNG